MKILSTFFLFAVITFTQYLKADDTSNASEIYKETHQSLAKVDKELNEAYKKAIARLNKKNSEKSKKAIEKLRASQKAWLKYRAEQVDFITRVHDTGSSSAKVAGAANYSIKLTKSRIKDLEEFPNPY